MKVSDRCSLAARATLTPEEWASAAADTSPRVRRIVAARHDAPAGALAGLARDPDRQTRRALACNPATTPEVLMALLDDADWLVRWEAVQHPHAGLGVRAAAAASPDQRARWALAQLKDLEPEFVEVLIRDDDWNIRNQLATSTLDPAVVARLVEDPHPQVRSSAIQNPAATMEHVRSLAEDRIAQVRATVASLSRTPRDVLLRLARDRSSNVRWWVCVCHDGDRELMRLLAEDADPYVAQHASAAVSGRLKPLP